MPFQVITDFEGSTLAILVSNTQDFPSGHNFLTQQSDEIQFAIFNHQKGHSIQRHWHPPFERSLNATNEVLLIKSGLVEASIYDKDLSLVHKQILQSGDVVILLAGGHGFEIIETATILEVKQGPYAGFADKKVF